MPQQATLSPPAAPAACRPAAPPHTAAARPGAGPTIRAQARPRCASSPGPRVATTLPAPFWTGRQARRWLPYPARLLPARVPDGCAGCPAAAPAQSSAHPAPAPAGRLSRLFPLHGAHYIAFISPVLSFWRAKKEESSSCFDKAFLFMMVILLSTPAPRLKAAVGRLPSVMQRHHGGPVCVLLTDQLFLVSCCPCLVSLTV